MVALPAEASEAQREALTRAFAERLSQGVAGYVAAIHDRKGNDVRNPHFHLVAIDAHLRAGGRGRPRSVLGMARKGAVEAAAEAWAEVHNSMMQEWGYGPSSMISHRSLADRGIERLATIYEGRRRALWWPRVRCPKRSRNGTASTPGIRGRRPTGSSARSIRCRSARMKQTIDWEEMMVSTERSAKAAARQAERSIGGVAQAIETQRRHSSELTEIRKSLAEIALKPPPRFASDVPAAAGPTPAGLATVLGLGDCLRRRHRIRRVFRELILWEPRPI